MSIINKIIETSQDKGLIVKYENKLFTINFKNTNFKDVKLSCILKSVSNKLMENTDDFIELTSCHTESFIKCGVEYSIYQIKKITRSIETL